MKDIIDQVNQLISNKALQFYENGKIKIIILKKVLLLDIYQAMLMTGYVVFINIVLIYNWYWWIFKTNINKAGYSILSSEVNKTIAYVTTVSGEIAFLPNLKIPSSIGDICITY